MRNVPYMKKIVAHLSIRFRTAIMFIFCILVIVLWPVFFIFCNHLWLLAFRDVLLEELDRLEEENERNSLW